MGLPVLRLQGHYVKVLPGMRRKETGSPGDLGLPLRSKEHNLEILP